MVGLADDPMTIYWNPAGMSNFDKPLVSFFAMDVIPQSKYEFDTYKIDATAKTKHYVSPNLTGYLPIMEGKMTLGFGAYVSSGLGVEWEGEDLKVFSGPSATAFEWYNYVRNINFSPALSYKFSEKFYAGAALNIKYGMLDMRRPLDKINLATGGPGEDGAMDTQYEESSSGIGVGFTVGVLYKPMEELSMGLTFRSPAKISLSGDAENPLMAAMKLPTVSNFDRDLTTPMWIAGGIAVKPMKNLTLTFDGQWSQWSTSAEYLETTYNDWGGILDSMELKWEDCLQIRFGAEYMANEKLALRAGYYYDPAPSPDHTLTIMFPSISFNAFTVGTGYKFGHFGVDLGLEYLIGADREIKPSDMKEDWIAMPGTHSMDIFAVSLGLNYYFD
jgi:long-chain fatty acid transport protein